MMGAGYNGVARAPDQRQRHRSSMEHPNALEWLRRVVLVLQVGWNEK